MSALGECSDREFEERITAWLSDPAEYSRIIYDYANEPNIIQKYFGVHMDNIENAINSIKTAVEEIQQLNAKQLERRSELIELGLPKSHARKLTRQFQMPEPDYATSQRELEAVLGTDRAGHFRHYIGRALRGGYVFNRSDVMDLMQMCYTYDCDLFRCDKSMARMFEDYEPFKNKLIARFSDLPDRIAALSR